jgi:hypothetical protein
MKNSREFLKHPRFAKSWHSFTPGFAGPLELPNFDLPSRSEYIDAPDQSQRSEIKQAGFPKFGLTSSAAMESDRVKFPKNQTSK